MDTFNTGPSASPSTPELLELRAQQRSLQNLLLVTLVALIIFGGGVALFIAKQMRMVQQNLAEQRPSVQRLVADYQRTSEPLIRNFSSALTQFAATNQDFRPILDKYRPILSNYLGAPLPVARPAAPATNR
jgi:hypothetical protein